MTTSGVKAKGVDGKNTYHAMARVIFQHQVIPSSKLFTVVVLFDPEILQHSKGHYKLTTKQKRSLTKPLPFRKPTVKPHPPRIKDLLDLVRKLSTNHIVISRELTWVLLAATYF